MKHYIFEFAIKFPDGQYYTGDIKNSFLPGKGAKKDAYTLTELGALTKMTKEPMHFGQCVVEKIL